MSMKPPLMDLHIKIADHGFYSGFSKSVAIYSNHRCDPGDLGCRFSGTGR